jgi:hypothetical protein
MSNFDEGEFEFDARDCAIDLRTAIDQPFLKSVDDVDDDDAEKKARGTVRTA